MDVDLALILEANRLALAELERRAAMLDDHECKARAVLQDCARQRDEIERDREALERAERFYRRLFVPSKEDDEARRIAAPDGSSAPKHRARIGPQRYRIFARLRQWNSARTPDEIAEAAGLSIKRVKDQLRVDVPEGFIGATDDGKFGLEPLGWNLLERFEEYKRARGEPLPSLEGPIIEEGGFSLEQEEELAA